MFQRSEFLQDRNKTTLQRAEKRYDKIGIMIHLGSGLNEGWNACIIFTPNGLDIQVKSLNCQIGLIKPSCSNWFLSSGLVYCAPFADPKLPGPMARLRRENWGTGL